MPPIAPLPFWPIDGLEFDPALHLERVLSVFGCHRSCPCFSSEQDRAYISAIFSNARDPRTGLQRQHHFPDVYPIYTRMDNWLYREHDHPLDPDLVFHYPRRYSFPALFTRPINIAIHEAEEGFVDDEVWTIARIHVADIHLRWTEIVRGVQDATYTPSRYPQDAYPFSRSYFRTICDLFRPHPHAPPPDLHLRHAATGLPVARASYCALMHLVVDFDLSHPPEHPSDPKWYLLWVPTSVFVRELEAHTGIWWFDLDALLHRFRLLAFGLWLDELRRTHAHSPADLRRSILGAHVVLSDWEYDADDNGWGWLMAGF